MLGIVGESGSGKTMTALAIAQLTPYPGAVRGWSKLDGHDLRAMPPRSATTCSAPASRSSSRIRCRRSTPRFGSAPS